MLDQVTCSGADASFAGGKKAEGGLIRSGGPQRLSAASAVYEDDIM
jgi:hypothetical protein